MIIILTSLNWEEIKDTVRVCTCFLILRITYKVVECINNKVQRRNDEMRENSQISV